MPPSETPARSNGEGERVCPHCGTDRWKAERADRREARMTAVNHERDRLARENGVLRSEAHLAREKGEEYRRALQRKIQRQARVIRRLEQKLLDAGQPPHEGAKPWEAAPVSDIPEIAE